MRCYWCDNDAFSPINSSGEVLTPQEADSDLKQAKDYACTHCGHLVSEPNPRGGNPEETLESVKEERDDYRAQLEQATAELELENDA